MMNQVNDGRTIQYKNEGTALTAGAAVYLGGGVAGIAVDDIANGEIGVLQLVGTYTLEKDSGSVNTTFNQGDPVKLSAGQVVSVTSAADSDIIGIAYAESISGSATIDVLLR